MIFVECHYLDKDYKYTNNSVAKEFTSQGDFNSWYRIAKTDAFCIIKVMKYNPNENPLKKQQYDAKIVSITSEFMV